MFTLSSISGGLELLYVNHTSMDENCKLKAFKNI